MCASFINNICKHKHDTHKADSFATRCTKCPVCNRLHVSVRPGLQQHLDSVHRWTGSPAGPGNTQGLKDSPPTSQLNVSVSVRASVCMETWQREMIENLLPWWQEPLVSNSDGLWRSLLFARGEGRRGTEIDGGNWTLSAAYILISIHILSRLFPTVWQFCPQVKHEINTYKDLYLIHIPTDTPCYNKKRFLLFNWVRPTPLVAELHRNRSIVQCLNVLKNICCIFVCRNYKILKMLHPDFPIQTPSWVTKINFNHDELYFN